MPDLKPPRLAAGDRETLLALLQYQRRSVVRKVEDVDDAAAAVPAVPSGTSLVWLLDHLARAELSWVVERFAGLEVDAVTETSGGIAAAVDRYRATWAWTDSIVASASLDDHCRNDAEEPTANLRWILLHLLEETARHAGHADILRELIDGRTGR